MAGARVLMIDDDTLFREMIAGVLRDAGYTVAAAPDGAEGLAWTAEFRPAVILLDLVMPAMNGYAFLHAYRATPPPHARVIVVSGSGTTTVPPGADAVLVKPFQMEDLLALVARHVQGT